MRDVIVIGSGISGLAAALEAARAGRAVTLLEATDAPGGLLKPVVRGEWRFDIGVQYLGDGGPGEPLTRSLEALGVDVALRPLDAHAERYDFPSYSTRLVRGREAQEASLIADFPAEADGIRWFFDVVQALYVLVGGAFNVLRGPARPSLLARVPDLAAASRVDLASFVAPRVRDPMLVNALAAFIGDIALPPRRANALSVLLDWAHFLRGGWFPVGGGAGLRDGFLQALSHLDVEVRTGAEVAAISPGAPHRVRLVDGGEVAGRAIVCAVDGTRVARWLGDALPPSERARAAAMPASLSANGVFLGVDLDLRALGFTDANRWRYEHDDLDAVFAPVLAGDEPEHLALYFASSSLKDPDNACAPAGCQSLTVLAWAPASRGPGDAPVSAADDDARRASRVFDAAMSAFPALRDHVVFREDFAPSDLWRHARARHGGFYGPEMSPAHSFPRRFSPRTGVPGIFQAGASVFGCGVVPSLLSGRIAGGLARASTWRPGRALLP